MWPPALWLLDRKQCRYAQAIQLLAMGMVGLWLLNWPALAGDRLLEGALIEMPLEISDLLL